MHPLHLRRVPLFEKLSEVESDMLSASLEVKRFSANTTIFWAGDSGSDFFILQSGRVQLAIQDESGVENPLAVLGPGDYFGELSLLDGGPRTATCRAITDVSVWVLTRPVLYKFLETNPLAGIHMLETLGKRQRENLEQLRGISNPNMAVKASVESGPLWGRIADKIAAMSASPGFLIFHIIWFASWTGFNSLAGERAFDPFPFGLLTMTVSLEAIFLSIFVLVSANRQNERDRIRSDVAHQVNLKAHHEVMDLQRKMDGLRDMLNPKP
ncbi:MAG TPA: cyclic nucleotide-binding domain-containing protein [Kiritimatiellia bacterium]|nr:cyclic nucleotide-binding domain-containing protein [Kiritimatiellia bacterium]